jgi:hypothetical protein
MPTRFVQWFGLVVLTVPILKQLQRGNHWLWSLMALGWLVSLGFVIRDTIRKQVSPTSVCLFILLCLSVLLSV